ncbi:hypothetical protein BH10ACI3_BH10ACI3_09050 [soil metagenome]
MELSLPNWPEGMPKRETPAMAHARELVLAHGWNSTSFQIVNPGISRWFSADNEAVVGFVSAGGVRVVVGAPVCDASVLSNVIAEYEADAKQAGEQVCYFAAETRLESVFAGADDHSKFLLGSQPVWQPANWAELVSTCRSVRSQVNRARNKRVTVSEWSVEKAHEHPKLIVCLRNWLDSKGLPPLHFMVESDTLSRLHDRRIFVAEQNGDVSGFVVLSPIATRNGWLFEQFPHAPDAPNGTVELMIDTAMRTLAADGAKYVTLGLSPLSTRASVTPFDNPVWLRFLLGWLRTHGRRFYNFDGLDAFKSKLRPERWEPVFAVSNEPRVSFRTLYAITEAFSGSATTRMVIGGLKRAAATEARWIRQRITGRRPKNNHSPAK